MVQHASTAALRTELWITQPKRLGSQLFSSVTSLGDSRPEVTLIASVRIGAGALITARSAEHRIGSTSSGVATAANALACGTCAKQRTRSRPCAVHMILRTSQSNAQRWALRSPCPVSTALRETCEPLRRSRCWPASGNRSSMRVGAAVNANAESSSTLSLAAAAPTRRAHPSRCAAVARV